MSVWYYRELQNPDYEKQYWNSWATRITGGLHAMRFTPKFIFLKEREECATDDRYTVSNMI